MALDQRSLILGFMLLGVLAPHVLGVRVADEPVRAASLAAVGEVAGGDQAALGGFGAAEGGEVGEG